MLQNTNLNLSNLVKNKKSKALKRKASRKIAKALKVKNNSQLKLLSKMV